MVQAIRQRTPQQVSSASDALDPERLKAATSTLLASLEDDDSSAVDAFVLHKELLQSAFPTHFADIERLVTAFEFAQALTALREAIQTRTQMPASERRPPGSTN